MHESNSQKLCWSWCVLFMGWYIMFATIHRSTQTTLCCLRTQHIQRVIHHHSMCHSVLYYQSRSQGEDSINSYYHIHTICSYMADTHIYTLVHKDIQVYRVWSREQKVYMYVYKCTCTVPTAWWQLWPFTQAPGHFINIWSYSVWDVDHKS